MKQKSIIILFCIIISDSFIKGQAATDTSSFWFNKTNYIILGAGSDYRNLDVVFKNNTANYIGNLSFSHSITDWKFTPLVNSINASVFATTKYGTFGLGQSISSNNGPNVTSLSSFNFAIPYKKIDLSFYYLKYKGLNRTEPVYNTSLFLKDMSFTPWSINLEWHAIGRLKNTLLYVPKKTQGVASLNIGFSSLTVTNPSDFIPALVIKKNIGMDDSIVPVNGLYMHQFTSRGFVWGVKYDLVYLLHKIENENGLKVFYVKAGISVGINSQKFRYYSYVDTLKNEQFIKDQKGDGATGNYNFTGLAVYDVGKFIIGVGASYYKFSYGKLSKGVTSSFAGSSNSETVGNHVEDIRINYNAFIGFRLDFKKPYAKIDERINKIMKK